MTTTVRDLIRSSLRLIGAYASGETPQASEEQDALDTLNGLVDTWSALNLMIYNTKREVFTTSSGVQAYTFGSSGTWATTSTDTVVAISAILDGNVELPLVEDTVGDWQRLVVKSTQSTVPTTYYIEKTWPNRTINLWPVPGAASQVAVYYKESIAEFAALDDLIDLPNGYRQALRYNLAILLCAEYGRQPDPVIVEVARSTISAIKRVNNDLDFMRTDFGVPTPTGTFNNRVGV